MDLTKPETLVLVGDWTSISCIRQLMLTLGKLDLNDIAWSCMPIKNEKLRKNYLWLHDQRLVWESRQKLKEKMRDGEDLWMLYER